MLYHEGQMYTVTEIMEGVFFNSKSLTSITLPPTITRICENAFAYCSSLKDVYCYFEDDLPAVEASVFANTPIADATLHVPAASINMYKATSPWNKFGSIKGTGSVTIDGLNYYLFTGGNEAALYKGNEWTGELDIPSEVKFQEQTYTITGTTRGAFADCPELTKVRIPKTLAKIWDSYTFFYNPYEDVPTGLINPIYMNIFTECTALESIEVEEGNPGLKSVDGVLFSQDGIGQYYYRTNKYYGTGLYCYPMGKQQKTYAIPEGVEWIGGAAFYDNQHLASLTIPRSMKHICYNAFSGCSNLMDVYCEAEDVPIAWDVVFNDIPNSATLHVPAGSIDKYKATSPWSHFGNIVALNDPVTFTAGQMATIVLPTEPDASKGKYYGLAGCEGNEIVFGQELHPQAHVPYIIVPYEDFSIDPAELDLAGLTGDTVSVDGISFIGAYRQTELKVQKDHEYVFIDTTPDCQYGDSVREVVGALRAYLTVNWDDPIDHGGARSPLQKMEIVLRDHGTGLETAGHSPQSFDCQVYDLSGRQVRTMRPGHQPGIYIVDGKKTAY
ncbi:MAG: leucine-rich repeat protein [Bacteroidaceae bacterium]|nr:leucine-rich repeat protein [Bacteroidaceae bacterium]